MMHNWRNSAICLACGLKFAPDVYQSTCPGKREPPDKITMTKFEYEPTRLHDPKTDPFDPDYEMRRKVTDFFK